MSPAPLVLVTDATDTKQTNARPLRLGDEVTVDGLEGIVYSVDIDYSSDRYQKAIYEVLMRS